MSGSSNNLEWPDVLRALFLGGGVMNNLVEPGIQLEELEKELPGVGRWFKGAVPEDLREVTREELTRQAVYFKNFNVKLNRVLEQIERILDGGGDESAWQAAGQSNDRPRSSAAVY